MTAAASSTAQALIHRWLERGRAHVPEPHRLHIAAPRDASLAHTFRRAYRWIAQQAIHTPYHDMRFGPAIAIGSGEHPVLLPSEGESYCSFLLLPLLTLATSRRLLFIGAPGRGKTTVATLMGLLAGYPLDAMRRAIQHGHPQLTVSDLLGAPLPRELIQADTAHDIRVSWRRWIDMRVKIIDEYNRIPTKTQSALLSLMAEGYAEQFEQTIETGHSAWFLTANDDLGGGTFPVIDALKDRIDIVVRCTPFDTRSLSRLAHRIQAERSPEAFIPADLILSHDDLDRVAAEIRDVTLPEDVLHTLAFLTSQLDFCRMASLRHALMSKDTLHLAGRKVAHVCTEDCPLDKHEHLCTQTENGLSARALQALLHLSQALAWFRGNHAVSLDDVREILPWVLHEKLQPNLHSAFFQKSEHLTLTTDRVSWIQQLFQRALTLQAAYQPTRERVRTHEARVAGLLDSAAASTPAPLRRALDATRQLLERLLDEHELGAPAHADILALKRCYADLQHALHGARRS